MANFHYRLLVIDDEPPGRDLLQSSLSKQGYEVCVAKDGFAALVQMRGALPDLIVSDLKMPNMSGFERPRPKAEAPEPFNGPLNCPRPKAELPCPAE